MLEPAYEAKKYEDKIYQRWEKSGAFKAKVNPKKKPFVISMPPPNATGTLHLGHAARMTTEDILTRHRRMKGFEALWLPGTDHAAIATQNKVEKLIAEEGLDRHQLGREGFLSRVREFVAESQDTIRNQIRKMGSSCDWSRERYTLDDDLNRAVMEVFNRMYEDGLIYRGHRLVNWCIRCQSTLADDEVEYEERRDPFYYIKYGPVTIGTARPETKFADKIIIVHPKDKRYKKAVGTELMVDWLNGPIKAKFVADEVADMDMGSGAMTITPAHSFVDFDLAKKYGFEIVPIIGTDGKMLPIAGEFSGMDVADCRKKLVEKMQKMGIMERIDKNYIHNLSICYRCSTPVQPLVSEQWFIDVNKKIRKQETENRKQKQMSLKEIAIDVVKSGQIEIIPERFNKIYFHWMENLRDWCISRQIWWGHRIPVWYCVGEDHCTPDCKKPIMGRTTPKKCPACGSGKLRQDEDTLDTWFSSALWTFSTLGWPDDTEDLRYFHPTSVMETAYDILFFWVARMIIMTTYALDDIPFKTVYLSGLIKDREGQKMSKSLGNGIDPLEMIEKFGADALRMSMIAGNAPGNDARLYEEKIKGYRNFTNKLWNASRFVLGVLEQKGLTGDSSPPTADQNDSTALTINPKRLSDADQWILAKLNDVIRRADQGLLNFKISEVAQLLYDFLWSDFCDWYLELSKGEKQNPAALYHVLKNLLILLHPFVPFVTEAIWSELPGQKGMLIQEAYPKSDKKKYDKGPTENVIAVITSIRRMRAENKIEPAKKVDIVVYGHGALEDLHRSALDIIRLARVRDWTLVKKGEKVARAATDVVNGIELFLSLEGVVDMTKEKERIEKEIANLEQYIESLKRKLDNKQFAANAPATIVSQEQTKLAEAVTKLQKLKQSVS